MNIVNKHELYTSPQAKVIDVKAQQVMCLSNNDLDGWNYDDNDL